MGLRFAPDRSERVLRGRRAIPNTLPDVVVVIVVADRKHRLGLLLVSLPADVDLRRRGRLRERGLQRAVGGRQLAASTRRLV